MAEPAFGISPEFAHKVLSADLKKTIEEHTDADGNFKKSLPAGVRKLLVNIAGAKAADGAAIGGTETAPNIAEVCRALGISRPTLYKYTTTEDRKTFQNANGGFSLAKVREFLRVKGAPQFVAEAEKGEDQSEQRKVSRKELAITRRAEYRADRELMDLELRQGEWRRVDEVNNAIDSANALVFREFVKAFTSELPPMQEGLTAAEIAEMNAEKIAEICEYLPKHFEKIAQRK